MYTLLYEAAAIGEHNENTGDYMAVIEMNGVQLFKTVLQYVYHVCGKE